MRLPARRNRSVKLEVKIFTVVVQGDKRMGDETFSISFETTSLDNLLKDDDSEKEVRASTRRECHLRIGESD